MLGVGDDVQALGEHRDGGVDAEAGDRHVERGVGAGDEAVVPGDGAAGEALLRLRSRGDGGQVGRWIELVGGDDRPRCVGQERAGALVDDVGDGVGAGAAGSDELGHVPHGLTQRRTRPAGRGGSLGQLRDVRCERAELGVGESVGGAVEAHADRADGRRQRRLHVQPGVHDTGTGGDVEDGRAGVVGAGAGDEQPAEAQAVDVAVDVGGVSAAPPAGGEQVGVGRHHQVAGEHALEHRGERHGVLGDRGSRVGDARRGGQHAGCQERDGATAACRVASGSPLLIITLDAAFVRRVEPGER